MDSKHISNVMASIQSLASQKFPNLFMEEDNSAILKVFDIAIANEKLPQWKRDLYKVTRKELDVKKIVENPKVIKQYNAFIDKQIKEAIKKGILPAKVENKYVPNV